MRSQYLTKISTVQIVLNPASLLICVKIFYAIKFVLIISFCYKFNIFPCFFSALVKVLFHLGIIDDVNSVVSL